MREYVVKKQFDVASLSELVSELDSVAVAQVFAQRGIHSKTDLTAFTKLQQLLAVDELHDTKGAFQLLTKHIDAGSSIVVYGDYDADGALAAAILWRFLAKILKVNATVYIPDRHDEGYGLNKNALELLAKQGHGLVITVDCGVRDRDLIREIASATKLEILVTDHHQPGETFPECPTVHPLYPEHQSKNAFTSGGVVSWKFVRFIEDQLGLGHSYSDSVVDLAGISLVTDIMPLLDENRSILKRGIQKLRVSPHLGIKSIMDVAQIKQSEVSTYHLGYLIGPRLNASGRIGDPYTSTRLLCTDNQEVARQLALQTHEINVKRQELTKQMLEEAENTKTIIDEKLIVAAGKSWDDGIIGLVAGKLMNTYDKPTLAISIDTEQKLAKGSARSLGEFNITQFLEEIKESFTRYGGHHNAAGFTLVSDDVGTFIETVRTHLAAKYADFVPVSRREIETVLSFSDLTSQFFTTLEQLEPYGNANLAPLFAVQGVVEQFTTIGQQKNHIKIDLKTSTGVLKCLFFDGVVRCSGIQQGQELTLIGKPKQEEYQGRIQVSFFVDDIVNELKIL